MFWLQHQKRLLIQSVGSEFDVHFVAKLTLPNIVHGLIRNARYRRYLKSTEFKERLHRAIKFNFRNILARKYGIRSVLSLSIKFKKDPIWVRFGISVPLEQLGDFKTQIGQIERDLVDIINSALIIMDNFNASVTSRIIGESVFEEPLTIHIARFSVLVLIVAFLGATCAQFYDRSTYESPTEISKTADRLPMSEDCYPCKRACKTFLISYEVAHKSIWPARRCH